MKNILHILKILPILLSLFLLSCNNSLSDKITTFDSYSESFETIESLTKDKKIIILGECGHSDGTTFEIKSDLVKYLNSKGDYTLILEGMNPFDGAVLNGELPVLIINRSMLNIKYCWYGQWSWTKELAELADAMDKNQIDFYGMESDPSYCSYFQIAYLSNLFYSDSTMKTNLFDYNWNKLLEIDQKMHQYNDSLINESDYPYYDSSLLAMRNKLSDNDVSFNKDAVLLLIDNMLSFSNKAKCGFSLNCDSCIDCRVIIRDRQMADNVAWYINHHPEKKIIIWAANFHGAKAISKIKYGKEPDPDLYDKYTLLGEHLANMFPDQVYSIAFTSSNFDDYQADTISIEHQFDLKNANFGFLDFSKIKNIDNTAFNSTALGYHNKTGYWSKSFDAMFFIKNQKASTIIEQQ